MGIKVSPPRAFSLAGENPPLPGCTISGALLPQVLLFSLAEGTDISPEYYPEPKLWINLEGRLTLLGGEGLSLDKGEAALLPEKIPLGALAQTNCVYMEIEIRKETLMNPVIKPGQVFALKDLLSYQEGKIVNMDLVKNDRLKLALMAFGEGTALSEHAAPGEALVLALEGEGIIGYEGEQYPIQAGESFHFAKNARHYVKANGPFKMALLLTL